MTTPSPATSGPDTLVFATSYSGNTEETLSAYADARRRGARIVVVTSGGELASRAAADQVPVVTIPGGQPPRTAMGFMLVPVLVARQDSACCRPRTSPAPPVKRKPPARRGRPSHPPVPTRPSASGSRCMVRSA